MRFIWKLVDEIFVSFTFLAITTLFVFPEIAL